MTNYSHYYDEPFGQDFPIEEVIEQVELIDETPEPTPVEQIGVVNAREVYIRMNAGLNNEPLGTVKKGDELLILGHEGGFYKIETEDGLVGYIMDGFVDVE